MAPKYRKLQRALGAQFAGQLAQRRKTTAPLEKVRDEGRRNHEGALVGAPSSAEVAGPEH